MNAPESSGAPLPNDAEDGLIAALTRFDAEQIQHLSKFDLLQAQSIAGHGNEWGLWQTLESVAPSHVKMFYRRIDLAQRLRDYLIKENIANDLSMELLEEGVLLLTRLALLIRLVPSGGRRATKNVRLKPTSLCQKLYSYWPQILARAIRRKIEHPEIQGLIECLTESDMREFHAYTQSRIELNRLITLVAMNMWSDAPPFFKVAKTTDPAGAEEMQPLENATSPYLPIPDDYMAKIGPRVLWVIKDLGPNLLALLESMPPVMENLDRSLSTAKLSRLLVKAIAQHQEDHPWVDRHGRKLRPSFPFSTTQNRGSKVGWKVDEFEWPPRTWESMKRLSTTLQYAHMFLTLLACAGRIGEVLSFNRNVVTAARDGKNYLQGWTYKLSANLLGDRRQWPAPEILIQCLGQQARLAAAWDRLPRRYDKESSSTEEENRNGLWLAIDNRVGGADADIEWNTGLAALAVRLDMDPAPGGKKIHAHRFRKTIGRLAGVALFNSPLVLKRLFGHKCLEMTLHYILCDSDIRSEAETVLRELRIMHCAEALQDIHEAIANGDPLPGNGGPGAGRLAQSVANKHEQLAIEGRVWDKGSAHDLAFLLTTNGQGWRLIKENIVCSKAPGEDGLCQKKRSKGEPNTSNCKTECGNRIVLMRHRRDVEAMAVQYVDIARQAKNDGLLLVLAHTMDNLRTELDAFPDLKELFLTKPEVQSLLKYCEEVGA